VVRVHTVLDAIQAFLDYLASVQPLPLAIAIGCHIVKTMCTSRAWRNVLAAAYPQERVRWLPIYGAYIAGVGVNAIFPARAGDVVRLTMAHRAVKGASYTTLVSSSAVLAIVDAACAIALFAWALTQNVLPGLDVLPSLPSFDFSWFFKHDRIGEIALLLLVFGLIALAVWIKEHVAEFRAHVGQAFTILHTPARWLRTVVLWQLADWGLRLTTIWFMLDAFGINQSLRNVLLVQATQSLATLLPVSPGGLGTEQAFLVYTLKGEAPRSALLAFSVGMRLTLTAVNVVLGFTAILLTLHTLRFRSLPKPVETADSG
jgi:glycosyltransferase 2 family protein